MTKLLQIHSPFIPTLRGITRILESAEAIEADPRYGTISAEEIIALLEDNRLEAEVRMSKLEQLVAKPETEAFRESRGALTSAALTQMVTLLEIVSSFLLKETAGKRVQRKADTWGSLDRLALVSDIKQADIDFGDARVQALQEIVKLRNDWIHPPHGKEQQIGVQDKDAAIEYFLEKLRRDNRNRAGKLGLPPAANMLTVSKAILCFEWIAKFLEYYLNAVYEQHQQIQMLLFGRQQIEGGSWEPILVERQLELIPYLKNKWNVDFRFLLSAAAS